MTQVDVIEFPAKMLLCLRNIQPDWLEARDYRLDFGDKFLLIEKAKTVEKVRSRGETCDRRDVTIS
jgi:hypothetical protein